jgi:hypothetical protein
MSTENHSVEEVETDLEINEEIELHKTSWKVQRVGWALLYAFLLLAALGMFGEGWFSKRTAQAPQATIKYERYFRYEGRMELKINAVGEGNTTLISFPNEYLTNFQVETIVPEPKESFISGGRVHYLFTSQGPVDVVFYLAPQSFGSFRAQVGVNKNLVEINHFIFP